MRIEHVAVLTSDLERLRVFYARHFQAAAGTMYENPGKQFRLYFLSFASGARLEIMQRPALATAAGQPAQGYAHLAVSVGSEAAVDGLVARLRAGEYPLVDGPRRTGDGYYEAVVLDPDGNRIEITV
jgi:lactoylglutathione lyase